MDFIKNKTFNLWHKIAAAAAFAISAVTYLCTIEPSASFWDCGEFIASSYKLEVGHPPGNPLFQLIARFFTMFGDAQHAAILVNAMSAICSALTIFFLYLTIVWLAKRLVRKDGVEFTAGQAIAIIGSGLVGALAYCFSDTFWFSAVEGEVYAMSSLFTAVVFWAMTMWYDRADEPHSARWIVLIAFLMGLSIGVHLLNLLAIPAIVFMFYYRRKDKYTLKQCLGIFLVGVLILAIILFFIVPLLPKFAAYTDLFFVNVLGLPYNTGAAFFMIALLAVCFWGIFSTMKKGKLFWNTVLLSLTTIIIGFSVFTIDIIRSCAKTPTNEYQPDNAFTLVRYLSREQYGSTPLVYGQYYDSPYELDQDKYYAPLDGKYKKVDGPMNVKYAKEGKMLFPRMWSSSGDDRYQNFYEQYTHGKGIRVRGTKTRKPTQGANLAYFFDYQLNWMYWRYFFWNFVGRQNDIHSPAPGNIFHGNWESGIGFIDRLRLGDQSEAPEVLADNKAKNHYFFLPLILGLIGLCFQFNKDRRGNWLTFLMFFMTGIAIVIYLNQPPYQVRERDYAYAGSFYFFSAWIGLGVLAIYDFISKKIKGHGVLTAAAVTVLCLFVPTLMAAQNWDDHDRSGRRTAVELASNYLNSVGPNGILITHGDNDTFPLWYAQEVESIRTDVRICNTSLLGTDWHIDQMKYACNESAPLKLSIPHSMYLYGTNEYIPIVDDTNTPMLISEVISNFMDHRNKVKLVGGRRVQYICARNLIVPVNRENCVKAGIMPDGVDIPDYIELNIPKGKSSLTKPELFLLDFLSNYDWSRPLNMLNMGGDLNIGIKEYLENEGFSYKFIPKKNKPSALNPGYQNINEMYRKMTQVYKWDALAADDYFIDYQNEYSFLGVISVRQLFLTMANTLLACGEPAKAEEMLDKGSYVLRRFPLETIPIGFSGNDYIVMMTVESYFNAGARDKANALADELSSQLLSAASFYKDFGSFSESEYKETISYAKIFADILKTNGEKERYDKIYASLADIIAARK